MKTFPANRFSGQVLPRGNPCLPCVIGNPGHKDRKTVNPTKRVVPPGMTVKKSSDFSYDGTYHVAYKGRKADIFCDPENRWWYIQGPGFANERTIGFNMNESLQTLADVIDGKVSRKWWKKNPKWMPSYSNEHFDRAQVLAMELTETDRKAGRPAPAYGYSKKRFDEANRMILEQRLDYQPPRKNPARLLVLNPSPALVSTAEKKLGRRLNRAELAQLEKAVREFKEFHGYEPKSIVPVQAPAGSPRFVNMIGKAKEVRYEVPAGTPSQRKGLWKHSAGDHGRTKKKTPPAFLASIPGDRRAAPIFVQPSGAAMYFKPSHGIMG